LEELATIWTGAHLARADTDQQPICSGCCAHHSRSTAFRRPGGLVVVARLGGWTEGFGSLDQPGQRADRRRHDGDHQGQRLSPGHGPIAGVQHHRRRGRIDQPDCGDGRDATASPT